MSYVIVLDPGHGGEEDGGTIGSYIEKNLNLAVAKAMKDYLEKFDGVTVYLTRYDDSTLSLQQRLDIAKSYNADYFICLHFNMSSTHSLYGSEVWLQAQNSLYNKMYPFADLVLNNFENMGLHNRGIKTRISSKGDNYYGVLRIGATYNIPSCIIEHCHMDNAKDTFAIPSRPEALAASLAYFGVQDADAMAKFLHLKSTELAVDYSGYKLNSYKTNAKMVYPDETEPEINEISILSYDAPSSTVSINIHAIDKQSFIQYYMISTDGGLTYTQLNDFPRSKWNKSLDNAIVTLKVPNNKDLKIVVAVVNSFDKITISNVVDFNAATFSKEMEDLNSNHIEYIKYDVLTNSYSSLFATSLPIGCLIIVFASLGLYKFKKLLK